MTRRGLCLLPVLAFRLELPASLILEDVLTATTEERQQGYFAVGQQAAVVVRPESSHAAILRGLCDRTVRLLMEAQP